MLQFLGLKYTMGLLIWRFLAKTIVFMFLNCHNSPGEPNLVRVGNLEHKALFSR